MSLNRSQLEIVQEYYPTNRHPDSNKSDELSVQIGGLKDFIMVKKPENSYYLYNF